MYTDKERIVCLFLCWWRAEDNNMVAATHSRPTVSAIEFAAEWYYCLSVRRTQDMVVYKRRIKIIIIRPLLID